MHVCVLMVAVLAQAPSDPTGFVGMLNRVRVDRGLPAVAYDGSAANAAACNNVGWRDEWGWFHPGQITNGLGHHYVGGYGQCSAMAMDAAAALAMWIASPAHRAILLDPNVVSVGYHAAGGWATASTVYGWGRQTFGRQQQQPMQWSYYQPRQRRWR